MKITHSTLDSLTAQAKASPRLRMNYDLRNSTEDRSQRMLNAIEPGTVLPVHRHRASNEIVICLRGGRRRAEYPCRTVAQPAFARERHRALRGEGRPLGAAL